MQDLPTTPAYFHLESYCSTFQPLQRYLTSLLLDLRKTILGLVQHKVMTFPWKKPKKKVQMQSTKNAIHCPQQGERQNKLLPCCLSTEMSVWLFGLAVRGQNTIFYSHSPLRTLIAFVYAHVWKKGKSKRPDPRLCSVLVSRSYQSL